MPTSTTLATVLRRERSDITRSGERLTLPVILRAPITGTAEAPRATILTAPPASPAVLIASDISRVMASELTGVRKMRSFSGRGPPIC